VERASPGLVRSGDPKVSCFECSLRAARVTLVAPRATRRTDSGRGVVRGGRCDLSDDLQSRGGARVPVVTVAASQTQREGVPVVQRVAAPIEHQVEVDGSERQAIRGVSGRFESRHPLVTAAIAAIPVGLVATWIAESVTRNFDAYGRLSYPAMSAVWTALFGSIVSGVAVFFGARSMASTHVPRIVGLGILAGVAAGAAGGFLTEVVYQQLSETFDWVQSNRDPILVVVRAVAWAPTGLTIGAAAGLVTSRHRLVPGLVGGGAGAALGGAALKLLFNAGFPDTGNVALYTGSVITAVGIVVGTTLADRRARSVWVVVTSGPLAGREITLLGGETTIGRDSTCDISLANDPEVSPHHLTIRHDRSEVSVEPIDTVMIDGVSVGHPVGLRPGATVSFGGTGIEVHWKAA